jgi:hypothetical protein
MRPATETDTIMTDAYGQAAALNREISAAELIATLADEAFAVFARLGSQRPGTQS